MRKLILPVLAVLALSLLCQTAEAGPLRRVAGGVRAAVSVPFRGVAARRERRMERRAARPARLFGC